MALNDHDSTLVGGNPEKAEFPKTWRLNQLKNSSVTGPRSDRQHSQYEKVRAPEIKDDMEVVVDIRDAKKHFGRRNKKNHVLRGLDMTVHKGTIYGLLGASGCGKTTILSVIVGLHSLNSGKVRVFGGLPGDKDVGVPGPRVGYMPQEIALYREFSIEETFRFFGRIYGMPYSEIAKQTAFLHELLDLPSAKSRIKNLSGGQKRRVSFGSALLHDPDLLILDEPTVGVDPVLRIRMNPFVCT